MQLQGVAGIRTRLIGSAVLFDWTLHVLKCSVHLTPQWLVLPIRLVGNENTGTTQEHHSCKKPDHREPHSPTMNLTPQIGFFHQIGSTDQPKTVRKPVPNWSSLVFHNQKTSFYHLS
ncbi:hypothetical protein XENOCAPTIV_003492 [Xenoophorus captivus]|uniref:Uncharacterized protein n=1 Tax=Xenoophorus captivus TaxID=1517983 RepID=A0ABV0Q8G2_9TELE